MHRAPDQFADCGFGWQSMDWAILGLQICIYSVDLNWRVGPRVNPGIVGSNNMNIHRMSIGLVICGLPLPVHGSLGHLNQHAVWQYQGRFLQNPQNHLGWIPLGCEQFCILMKLHFPANLIDLKIQVFNFQIYEGFLEAFILCYGYIISFLLTNVFFIFFYIHVPMDLNPLHLPTHLNA